MQECNAEAQLTFQARELAVSLTEKLKEHSLKVALAESCTAGLISSLLAQVPGASDVLWGSFVCYTKEAKVLMLGLDKNKLETFGLVSKETASCMAENALLKSGADMAAAVTGLAGPGGDGSSVPVGTVFIAAALKKGGVEIKQMLFSGSRNEVRIKSASAVLEMLITIVDKK